MQPYDGDGQGKSTYWTWQLRSIAVQNGEECPCWENSSPILLTENESKLAFKIKCASKSSICRPDFKETERELNERYQKFYNIQSNDIETEIQKV